MSKRNTEDISILLGRIQARAELIVQRATQAFHIGRDSVMEDCFDAQRILELIENWQSASLVDSLEQSIAAITSLPNETVYAMNASEIADVVRKADSNLKQTGRVIEVQGKDEYL